MSNKSNEERLKILQERLSQIHEKNNYTSQEQKKEEVQEEHVQQSNENLKEIFK